MGQITKEEEEMVVQRTKQTRSNSKMIWTILS